MSLKECIAFFRACQRQLGHKKLLVDAAGGHGGIACVFRAHRRADRAAWQGPANCLKTFWQSFWVAFHVVFL